MTTWQRPSAEMLADAEWCERAYNPRTSVADVPRIVERWTELAAAARQRLPHEADVRYGAHPREVLDIFRSPQPRGALAFIHGGYWRAFSKAEFSWVADVLVPMGYTVALLNYPLCPEVTVADIAASCRRAMATLWSRLAGPERGNLVVCGHSAGGYLTGAMFATRWSELGLPASPFSGGLPISGVFDLAPLVNTTMNAAIRFTPSSARETSIDMAACHVAAPMLFAVGALESSEFHRQSAEQAERWAHLPSALRAIPGRHHFDVIEELREEGSPLLALALNLLKHDR